MARKPLTAQDVFAAYEAGGWPHAERCVEDAESQFGKAALTPARVALEQLFKLDTAH